MAYRLLIVFVGGGIGSVARYLLQGVLQNLFNGVFPWGTLAVNLLGCLTIGLLYPIFEERAHSAERIFLFIGILGGFTTFSSFGLETANLIGDREAGLAVVNVLASNVIGLAMVFCGFFLGRWLLNVTR